MTITTLPNGNVLLQSGFFPPVRAASTGSPLNPATGGLPTVDGVTLIVGDRVLCKDETNAVNNGIYAAQTGPWVRTSDASNNQQFFSGMAVICGLGTVNAKTIFICTCTDDPVIVGTSLITFAAQLPIGAGNVVGPGSSTTGDVATFADTTGKLLQDTAVTGSGSVVKATSPALTTPALGAATATSINKVAITAPASGSTLTVADGKTLTANATVTFAGTDGKTVTVNATVTFAGVDGKTFTLDNSLEFAGVDGTKFTFPGSNDNIVGLVASQTLTNKTLTTPVIASISGNSGAAGTLSTGTNGGTGGQLTLNGATSGSAVVGVSATGTPQYGGTATNDNAPAGNVGEYAAASCPTNASTATVTISIASPGVVTWTAHPFSNTAPRSDASAVVFTTSGALPTGLTAGTVYYVVPSSITANTFQVATTVAHAIAGTSVNTTGTQSGTQTATAGASFATATATDVCGVPLTAGDWDVWGVLNFTGGSTATVNYLEASLTATPGTLSSVLGQIAGVIGAGGTLFNYSADAVTVTVGPTRLSFSATTNVYLDAKAGFGTVSTLNAGGVIQARRAR